MTGACEPVAVNDEATTSLHPYKAEAVVTGSLHVTRCTFMITSLLPCASIGVFLSLSAPQGLSQPP